MLAQWKQLTPAVQDYYYAYTYTPEIDQHYHCRAKGIKGGEEGGHFNHDALTEENDSSTTSSTEYFWSQAML